MKQERIIQVVIACVTILFFAGVASAAEQADAEDSLFGGYASDAEIVSDEQMEENEASFDVGEEDVEYLADETEDAVSSGDDTPAVLNYDGDIDDFEDLGDIEEAKPQTEDLKEEDSSDLTEGQ